MIIELELPDNAGNIRCAYQYKDKDGETVYVVKAIEGVRFKAVPVKVLEKIWKEAAEKICGHCGEVDYSDMYLDNVPGEPPDTPMFKCERYGCLVKVTDKCKGEK